MTDDSSIHDRTMSSPAETLPTLARVSNRIPRRAGIVGAAAAATLGLSSCATDAPQDTWQPAGENAQMIHDLQWPIFMVAGIVGVIVLAFIGFIVLKYRDKGQPIPEQTHGKAWLEYLFIAIPAVILAAIAIPTVGVVFALADTDDTECNINVTGQQWWWEYDYEVEPDGSICGFAPTNGEASPIITSGQVVIPAGTKVLLRGTSRDVIHSYWIPKLNGKRDMVPGRVHYLRLSSETPGIYAGQCTEFCGLSHANMRMETVVLEPADFQSWLDNELEPYSSPDDGTLAKQGEATFIAQCARCHQVNGLVDDRGTDDTADDTIVVSYPDQFVYSGAAQNLTNLMMRNTFAGATWDLLTPECRADVWEASPEEFGDAFLEGVTEDCFNEIDLREWLRNSPAKKPMYADAEMLAETDGKTRGMPYLALSEDQIDQLIAYLLERK